MNMNFMKKKATPSVVYEQRPFTSDTVQQVGESSSSSSYYNPYYSNPYMNTNPNPNPNPAYPYYGYPNPNYGGGGGGGGYYGGASPPPAIGSSSKPPPPPPSPPRASAWDFLNPFQTEDKYYSQYTPSRDSREVREEEGIPDLEDEDYFQHEVVKEVQVDQKFAGDGRGKHHSKAAEEGISRAMEEPDVAMYQTRPTASVESDRGVQYDVHVVDKKVVGDEDGRGKEAAFKGRGGDVFEVVKEIEAQFQRASESGSEIAQLLEVGKLPYHRKHGKFVCFFGVDLN